MQSESKESKGLRFCFDLDWSPSTYPDFDCGFKEVVATDGARIRI